METQLPPSVRIFKSSRGWILCACLGGNSNTAAGKDGTQRPSLLLWASILFPDKAAFSLSSLVLASAWIYKENCLFQPSKAPSCETWPN